VLKLTADRTLILQKKLIVSLQIRASNYITQEIYQAMLWLSKAKLKPTKGQNFNM